MIITEFPRDLLMTGAIFGVAAFMWAGPAFAWYVAVFWLEVAAMIILVVLASRRKRSDLTAPLILAVVGIHFIPLAWVFMQPVFAVAGAVLTAAAVVAALVPDQAAARSFWCGLPGSGTLLLGGAACAAGGFGALG